MWHPRMVKFDARMKKLFDEVDHYVEDLYCGKYNLHPVRPKRGETSNPEADGLFNVGARFTPGIRSELGRGYIIDVKIATLEKIDDLKRREIQTAVAKKVEELLPIHFPERKLVVKRDINHYKILGDFCLGII